jgi:hypothetical protein
MRTEASMLKPPAACQVEHMGDGGLVEEFAPPEEAEHVAAHHLLKPLDVPGCRDHWPRGNGPSQVR